MRINNEMLRHRDTVRRKTINGETYQRGSGSFIMNGEPLKRTTVQQAEMKRAHKYLLCGTCGVLLSLDEIKECTRCRQEQIIDDKYLVQVAEDWQAQEVAIQHRNPKRDVRRRDLTDEVSTVTSAAETHMQAEDAFEKQCKLSLSAREIPSDHRLTEPVDVGAAYRKFMSGFGMQEPWEKVYSQGERLWLPSRAGMSRQTSHTTKKVTVGNGPSRDRSPTTDLHNTDLHKLDRSDNSRQMRMQLRREPSVR